MLAGSAAPFSKAKRWGLGCLALVLGAGCRQPEQPSATSRGVLVVAVDGLRADHVGAFGGQRPTTPQLDSLAAEGLVFRNAIAAAPLLEPAHIGILTGCAPELSRQFFSHESGAARWQIPGAVPHMAVEFLSAGYRTAAFIDESTLAPSEGFARGFQDYLRLSDEVPSAQRAGRHAARIESWLNSLDKQDSWFAYLELSDLNRSWTEPLRPWDTYFRPAKGPGLQKVPPVGTTDSSFFTIPYSRWNKASRSLGEYKASYDGHLRCLDQELGLLFARLRNLGRAANTTLVVLGSHGTQFGEEGLYLTSGLFSLADLHVPLLVRPRVGLQQALAGTEINAVVSLIDLAPTLLEMDGIQKPPGMHGRSLFGYFAAQAPSEPVREYAYASSGLIEGHAMLGERFVLEVLRPSSMQNRLQSLSWNGSDQPAELPDLIRYYDRQKNPFPSLEPYERGSRESHLEFVKLRRAGEELAGHVYWARSVLQRGGLWGKPVDQETLDELVRLGYLGPQP